LKINEAFHEFFIFGKDTFIIPGNRIKDKIPFHSLEKISFLIEITDLESEINFRKIIDFSMITFLMLYTTKNAIQRDF
jgi:hypothetical protein